MKLLAVSLLSFCLTASAFAQGSIPPLVTQGLQVFQENGAQAALAIWLKGSPVEKNTDAQKQVLAMFGQIERSYGKMIGSEPLRVVPVSHSVMRVYVILKFERGPLYAAFDCYKATEEWVIPTMDFNVKPAAIIPASLW